MRTWINTVGYIGFIADEGYDEYIWSWETGLAERVSETSVIGTEFITEFGFFPEIFNLTNRLYLFPIEGEIFTEEDLNVKLRVKRDDCWYEINPNLNCDPFELIYNIEITETTFKLNFSLIYISTNATTITVISEDVDIVGESSNYKVFNNVTEGYVEFLRGHVVSDLVVTIEVELPNDCSKKFLITYTPPSA